MAACTEFRDGNPAASWSRADFEGEPSETTAEKYDRLRRELARDLEAMRSELDVRTAWSVWDADRVERVEHHGPGPVPVMKWTENGFYVRDDDGPDTLNSKLVYTYGDPSKRPQLSDVFPPPYRRVRHVRQQLPPPQGRRRSVCRSASRPARRRRIRRASRSPGRPRRLDADPDLAAPLRAA
jgi:hypothetical protein